MSVRLFERRVPQRVAVVLHAAGILYGLNSSLSEQRRADASGLGLRAERQVQRERRMRAVLHGAAPAALVRLYAAGAPVSALLYR